MDARAGPPVDIFVVDDNEAMRKLIHRAISTAGFRITSTAGHEVLEFATAEEALAAMMAGARPALIITDVNLGPGKSGLALAREARLIDPRLPILVVTGQVVDYTNQDVTAILEMPFRVADLERLVNWCLQLR